MPLREAFFLALEAIRTSKLRSFFTLLGIIVSVGFLVAVVAIIQGMNSYVRDNLRGAMIGTNSFQVRRSPIALGNLDDSTVREINKRPIISQDDALVVRAAITDAEAVSLQEKAIEKGGKGNPEYTERLQRYKNAQAPAPR